MKILRYLIFVLVLLPAINCGAYSYISGIVGLKTGTDYFVATDGNDTTGDGSIGTPWATLTKATTTVSAGDTIYIRAGTYNEESYIDTSGTSRSPIKIMNYNGETVIFDGENTRTRFIRIGDFDYAAVVSYVWIDGLEIKNYVNAIRAVEGANNNVIKNIHAHNNSADGIVTFQDTDLQPGGSGFNLIQNCHAEYNDYHGIKIAGVGNIVRNCVTNHNGGISGDGQGLQISDNNWDVIVDGLITHNNNVHGVRVNAKPHNEFHGAVLRNITSYSNTERGLQLAGQASNILVVDALIYSNTTYGVSIDTDASDSEFYNVTSHSNSSTGVRLNSEGATGIDNILFDNLLSYNNGGSGNLELNLGPTNITITDSIFHTITGANNVRINVASDVEISDSYIYSGSHHGIALYSNAQARIDILRNSFYDHGSQAIQSDATDFVSIVDNVFYTAELDVADEIELVGTNTNRTTTGNTLAAVGSWVAP